MTENIFHILRIMNVSNDNIFSDDVLMTDIFINNVSSEVPLPILQITSHYQQKISKEIEDMARIISGSAKIPIEGPYPNILDEYLEKYKALMKIQNCVLFMTNLIHKSELNP